MGRIENKTASVILKTGLKLTAKKTNFDKGITMSETASKDDVLRLHQRFDEFLSTQTAMAVDVAVIKTKVEAMPKPASRPCAFFNAHIEEHEKAKTLWQTPLVETIFDFSKMAIVAVITWFLAKK